LPILTPDKRSNRLSKNRRRQIINFYAFES
jgi:hypothetical protein